MQLEEKKEKVNPANFIKWEDEDTGFGEEKTESSEFGAMLDEVESSSEIKEGTIVKGRVVRSS